MIINICKDFSETPGARYRLEGDFSGEEFREDILKPKFEEIKETNEKMIIELDGGMARIYGSKMIKDKLEFISNDEPSLVDEILSYIDDADKE